MCIRDRAEEVLKLTGARGLMIGRGAIRNPWMFRQIRQHLAGQPVQLPLGRDVLAYVHALYEACLLYTSDAADERSSVDLGGRRLIKKKTNKSNMYPSKHG